MKLLSERHDDGFTAVHVDVSRHSELFADWIPQFNNSWLKRPSSKDIEFARRLRPEVPPLTQG